LHKEEYHIKLPYAKLTKRLPAQNKIYQGYVFKGEGCYKIVDLNEEKKIMTEKTKEAGIPEKRRTDENVIYVGQKPPMSYVLAVVTQFNSGSDEVILKARGRAISTAVDAAEITRNRFFTDAELKEIKIGTESVTNEEGRTSNVSSMEICLTKKKSK
jgi:archaea-specific DNA-binding protein